MRDEERARHKERGAAAAAQDPLVQNVDTVIVVSFSALVAFKLRNQLAGGAVLFAEQAAPLIVQLTPQTALIGVGVGVAVVGLFAVKKVLTNHQPPNAAQANLSN